MKNVAIILAAVFSIAVGAQVAGEMPQSWADTKVTDNHLLSFDSDWRFLHSDAPGADAPGFDDAAWKAPKFDDGKWQSVTLPNTPGTIQLQAEADNLTTSLITIGVR